MSDDKDKTLEEERSEPLETNISDRAELLSRRAFFQKSYSAAVVGILFGTVAASAVTGCYEDSYSDSGYSDAYSDSGYSDSYSVSYSNYSNYSNYYNYSDYYVGYSNYYAFAP